jgi:hypothetical protein
VTQEVGVTIVRPCRVHSVVVGRDLPELGTRSGDALVVAVKLLRRR